MVRRLEARGHQLEGSLRVDGVCRFLATGQHDAVGAPLDEPASMSDEIGAIGRVAPAQLAYFVRAHLEDVEPAAERGLGEGAREVGHDGDAVGPEIGRQPAIQVGREPLGLAGAAQHGDVGGQTGSEGAAVQVVELMAGEQIGVAGGDALAVPLAAVVDVARPFTGDGHRADLERLVGEQCVEHRAVLTS